MLEPIGLVFVYFAFHYALHELWRYFGRPSALFLLQLLMWLTIPFVRNLLTFATVFNHNATCIDILISMLLLYFCLDFFQQLLLGGMYIWFCSWRDWKKMPNRLPAEQKAR